MKNILIIFAICILTNANAHTFGSKLKLVQDSITPGNDNDNLKDLYYKTKIKKQDFLVDILSFVVNLFLPNHGKYNEVSRRVPPYTFFDNGDISGLRNTIRDNIINEKFEYKNLYEKIFNLISDNSLPSCSHGDVCGEATKAKCAAFVYFIGLDKNKNDLGAIGSTGREYYYNLAVGYIKGARSESSRFGSFSRNTALDRQRFRSFELIQYLQAYDYLQTTRIYFGYGNFNDEKQNMRDKLADFAYELHAHANNLFASYEANNNIAIIASSAVGLASLILYDETVYIWQNQKKPERWGHAANAYIARTMWEGPSTFNFVGAGPMGSKGKMAGYGEGSHYFAYGFQTALPFIKAYYQSTEHSKSMYDGSDGGGREYYPCALCIFGVDQEPYNSKSYTNLYKWYLDIMMPNNESPTVDDTWKNINTLGAIAITGDSKNNPFTDVNKLNLSSMGENSYDLKADYLLSLNYPSAIEKPSVVNYGDAGDLIVRDKYDNYLHVNAERGTALNGDYHEHGDVSSFIVAAGPNGALAIDPAYYGGGGIDEVNEGFHHNVILFDDEGPNRRDNAIYSDIYYGKAGTVDANFDIKKINVKANYFKYILGARVGQKGTVDRTIEAHQYWIGDPYYVITDHVDNTSSYQYEIKFSMNGNGLISDGTAELVNSNTMLWKKPCSNNPNINYKLYATTSKKVSNTNTLLNYDTYDHPMHGEYTGGEHHTRVKTNGDQIPSGEYVEYLTTLQIRPCNSTQQMLTRVRSTTKYTLHLIEPVDYIKNIHVNNDNNNGVDTILNPLGINSSAALSTDAQNIFLSYSTDREFKTGNCYTFTNFRKARIETGRELSYNDTTYILSTKYASAYYSLEGKYKYKGYVQTDTACDVKLYLADLDTNYAMSAVGISYNYNDTTHIMTLHAPVGNTNFTIELADPCLMSCFFPYTTDSIKNTFDFATGTKETLPHKLTITTPNGYLKIRNGSHMQICSGKWLRNKDSLIVDYRCPEDGDQGKGLVVCPDVVNRLNLTNPPPTISQLYPSTDDYTPSQITVNSYAALILDSGSYTRFGNNTKLTIKPYASFIIRKNAKLDIGDAKSCGHAEIICEPNSYVHFEDSADIQFWQMKDTNDIHLFYISLKPQATAAHAGIEPAMLDMLLTTDHIIDTSIAHAEPICEVAKIRAAYGINKRDWGFGNFIKPKAWAYMANDTICPDECLYVNYDRMLNDVKRGITICQIDTIYNATNYNIIYTGCYSPAIPGGNMGMTASSGDGCDSIKNSKPISFCDLNAQIPGKWYRIFLSSYNDCDQLDTMKLYFIRMPRLLPDFTMADTGCTGIGSVTADENNDWNSRHFRDITKWHVHVIDSAAPNYLLQSVQYGGDWEYEKGAFPNTFTFPNFNWIGGFRYAVSHTIGTRGCKDTTMWDTIMIVPGAYIQASKPTVYAEPIAGATSVKLQGYIRAADSFTWTPNDWLNRTDTLSIISTPHESVSYILSAYKGACVARDTISIRYNELSNIGTNDTLCYNKNIIALGNHYNAAMFLGWLQYYDVIDVNTELRNIIANLNNDDIYFDRYLKYFDSYMLAGRFKESQDTSCFAYYDLFKNSETYNWEMIFKDSQFVLYYNNYLHDIEAELIDTSIASTKINRFKTFIRDAGFSTIIEKYPIDSNRLRCFRDLFANYESYLRGIYDESYYPMNVNWSKIEGQDTSSIDWENEYIAVVNPTKTTTYIQQALFPYGDISIDTKTIFIDTSLTPLFYPSMQWDSSAYFTNGTSPSSSTNTYLWNFGDGSATSADVNPFHTFPAFDSNYVVCLTATNRCGSYTYCDTVWIDSLHLGGSFKVAGFKQPERNKVFQNTTAINQQSIANNCQLSNYPNPFDQSTIIDYEIWQTFSKAELRITNVLGQEIYIQRLNRPMDKVQIDGSALHDGLYYYSLIVDGAVKLTKTMSVIR